MFYNLIKKRRKQMEYIAGQPHKQVNKVYLYNKGTSKIHIYGDYYHYLKNRDIKYLNVSYKGNRVYFIPCLNEEEENVIPKPVKLSETDSSYSFNCANLFKIFNIIINKPIKKGAKSTGHNLNYIEMVIDRDRCCIYFDIPLNIITQNIKTDDKIKEIKDNPQIDKNFIDIIKTMGYKKYIESLPSTDKWGKYNSDSYNFCKLYSILRNTLSEEETHKLINIDIIYEYNNELFDDKLINFIKHKIKNASNDTFHQEVHNINKFLQIHNIRDFFTLYKIYPFKDIINMIINFNYKQFIITGFLKSNYNLGLKCGFLLSSDIIQLEDINKFIKLDCSR
jgi:hypothetical protein